jgi:hypothetical protein
MKNCLLSLVVMLTVGCSPRFITLSDEEYNYYSAYMAFSEACFQTGNLSPKLFGDAQHNLGVVLSIRDFDRDKLKQDAYLILKEISSTNLSDCPRVEADSYSIIKHGERIQSNLDKPAPVISYPTPNKLLWCNTVGTVTMCN